MKKIRLNGSWLLNAADAPALPMDIPVKIPGDIASALLTAGIIEDPYYGRNELDCLWIGRTDWQLSTVFTLSPEDLALSGKSAALEFDAIDTVAEIRLNGQDLGSSRNMFRRIRLNIAGTLKAGENHLEVLIRSPEVDTAAAAAKLPYPIPHGNQFPWQWAHRNLLRKVGCHGGWDWGLTLMIGGIYETPVLSIGGEGRIEYLTTRQERRPGGSDWVLTVHCEYESLAAQEVTLEYEFDGSKSSETFSVEPGVNILEHVIPIKAPELWWPAGQGGQKLYELKVGIPEETVTKNIGFRTVEVDRSMSFRINGRDVFAKGANWIPVDAFPSRQTDDVYRRLLEDAAEANMNMIRLWGGGEASGETPSESSLHRSLVRQQ